MIKLTHPSYQLSDSQILHAERSIERLLSRRDLGFFDLPNRRKNWEQAAAHGAELKKKYRKLVILGIGGSSLGGLALQECLQLKQIEFFENVDAKDFWDRLNALENLQTIHWVVISKSGKTIETLTQVNFINEFLKAKGIDFSKVSTVVTETSLNPLNQWANKNKVPLLEIPADVGGRFSVLTPVGLLPGAFGGVEIEEVRLGAERVLKDLKLVALLVAFYLESFKREKWISVFWPYSNRMRYFGKWLEQLWAESLGKKQNRLGLPAPRVSTPISLVGANDQHSVLQQIVEGSSDKFVSFFRVGESETTGPKLIESLFAEERSVESKSMGELFAAEATATRQALEAAGIPSLSLELSKLDARTVGFLFMLFELVVGGIGEACDINAFDQPGVELGKRLAKEILLK